ncbi:DUF4389 domain-containing protein [Pseudarthrobacter sp. NamB4]|uniref:DUF4389 domain-containing protein n=1 Tax=Pseudarthrobacter sp. NamB4 TaxID=2576837 RepID=UPI0010FCF20A|nr:DUF4389 domain-containing protein [Pseudarthrobacter sp. NamB4]TLM73587.1 DUF4389 domain-containing protein [Pseudarthrobacter sp. NamB4]
MKKTASVVLLILGILISIVGAAALAGGAVASVAGSAQGDGYLSSGTGRFSIGSHALSSPRLESVGEGIPPRLPFDVGTLRLHASSVDRGKEIFIGIAPQADVEKYLSGVHHSELLEVDSRPFRAEYRDIPGTNTPAPPAEQTFWSASVSDPGEQELTWDFAAGTWAIVIMNADASSGMDTRVQAGFRSDLIRPAATGLLVGGTIALAIGLPLLILGAVGIGRHAGPSSGGPVGPAGPGGPAPGYPAYPAHQGYRAGTGTPGTGGTGVPGTAVPGTPGAGAPGRPGAPGMPSQAQPSAGEPADRAPYPARLFGELDPGLSRAMWLVKWFLAIPHFILLVFLWFAFLVTTIVAGFAILFTGRYPRALFDFNVGVIRWNWRVAFYAYAAAGTDLYPPFTLRRTNYPADFEVDYPERLSRGLVLVKWWLLSIPHLLIVAALAGTTWTWAAGTDDLGTTTYEQGTGMSLLGLLVLIAVVALLFTGRYLRPLFDLILGVNRWIYRVMTYTALMRDEYPPFRLDQGPGEAPAHLSALPLPDSTGRS